MFNEIIAIYLENGGTLTSKTTGMEPKKIGYLRFGFNDEGLKTVYMPDSIEYISWDAFKNNNIVKVQLSNKLTYIGENVFSNNSLTGILLPNSVEEVDMCAFSYNYLRIVQQILMHILQILPQILYISMKHRILSCLEL